MTSSYRPSRVAVVGILTPQGRVGRRAGRTGIAWAEPAWPALAGGTAAILVLLAATMQWHGADTPAQLYRMDLFRREGLTVWNNHWYGGHFVPPYSVLYPPLAATLGTTVVAVGSAVLAAVCFERLLHAGFGRSSVVGGIWFAVGAAGNVTVGRLTFSLGMALALGCLLSVQRARNILAAGLAVSSALASPLAALFLVLAAAARWLPADERGPRPRAAVGASVAAAATVLALCAAFPQDGEFPFRPATLMWSLAVSVLVWIAVPTSVRVVRAGAVLYGAACLATFLAPNPVGANVTRLGMLVAGPVLGSALWTHRRTILTVVAVPLAWWQLSPAVDAVVRTGRDPSTRPAYHQPLLDQLDGRDAGVLKVEVPFTRRHWEAAYLPPRVLLARGWERQLDMARNPLFYEAHLSPDRYRRWLLDNGVSYVALPDTELDPSGRTEARLLRQGLPFLQPVWSNEHWQLWKVAGGRLVDGPARAASVGSDDVVLHFERPGSALIRLRDPGTWSVHGSACVARAAGGWTRVVAAHAGTVRLHAGLPFPSAPARRRCDDGPAAAHLPGSAARGEARLTGNRTGRPLPACHPQ